MSDGAGNGNPLQCSCLEYPRDGGAWWSAVCGVAQSRTRLKRLSSSSSMSDIICCLSFSDFTHLMGSSLSIHVAANGIVSSCLWLRKIPWYLLFFIHSSVDEHLGCFRVLTTVNSAGRNMGMHVSFLIIVLSGYTPRIGTAGSQGNSVFRF